MWFDTGNKRYDTGKKEKGPEGPSKVAFQLLLGRF
jgi:hypothetical protein